ncbi:hypothetical protein BKA82DRAFT_649353 [Pisolithus tinctorius]|uniref:Uncharacterized protein n=1 Tax=Pisolithus tinctorius Marx 270 TaxID=870435 RepID=A0A0C3NNP1_PISTI|nr:hypothetical protein BKA82DRAFT_649353 [Pisolithus tinctorius]KIO02500.1 hypothetical protein M404DRAFT_649353 [Pisolithus tinctorius Marx 270]
MDVGRPISSSFFFFFAWFPLRFPRKIVRVQVSPYIMPSSVSTSITFHFLSASLSFLPFFFFFADRDTSHLCMTPSQSTYPQSHAHSNTAYVLPCVACQSQLALHLALHPLFDCSHSTGLDLSLTYPYPP